MVDGYSGQTYAKLSTQADPNDANTTWVCYQIVDPSAGNVGGRFDVSGPRASGGLPSYDNQYLACRDNGYAAPPVQGTLLSQPFLVGAATPSGAAWVCLQAGSNPYRVIVPVPGVGAPSVTSHSDAAPPAAPTPTANTHPSGTCQAHGGTQLMNANVHGTQVWAYEWRPDSTTVDICARVEGAASAGGVLSVSATGSPGITPVATPGSNPSICGFSVIGLTSPVVASLGTSQSSPGVPGGNPASVCLGIGSTVQTFSVGYTGQVTPPSPAWTPDP